MTPRLRVENACARLGAPAVVSGCLELLAGGAGDPGIVEVLGGEHGRVVLAQGVPPVHAYWLRVWGARGLLYAWDPDREPDVVAALVAATADDAWRVREAVCRVVAGRLLGDALDAVAALRHDPVPRVREAAYRALVRLTAAGA